MGRGERRTTRTHGGALGGFPEQTDRLAESHSFPEGYRFDRDELCEDRA